MPITSSLLISYISRAISEGQFPNESLKSNLLKSINTLGIDLDDNDYEPSTDLEEVIAMLVDDLNELEDSNVEDIDTDESDDEDDDEEVDDELDEEDEDDDIDDDDLDDELDDDDDDDDEDDFDDEDEDEDEDDLAEDDD